MTDLPRVIDGRVEQTAFASDVDFWRAVVRADSGMGRDRRLDYGAATLGLSEGGGAAGGFLVPPAAIGELWTRTYDSGLFLNRVNRQPVTRGRGARLPTVGEDARTKGSRFGGVVLSWTDEESEAPEGNLKFGAVLFDAKKLLGTVYATDELTEDAAALAPWINRAFGLEAAFAVEDALINGSGIGQPFGILNADATITVPKESGQGVLFAANNFTMMMERLWGPSRRNSVWLTNNTALAFAETLQLANGKPLVKYVDGMPAILGRPAFSTEYTAPAGERGDIVLLDPSQITITETAPNVMSSIHVRFLEGETAFRFRWRLDAAPMWDSAITPANDTQTQSAYVTLEAREIA